MAARTWCWVTLAGHEVKLDTEDKERVLAVAPWQADLGLPKYPHFRLRSKSANACLPHYLLGVDDCRVLFINKDRKDFRKTNLLVKLKDFPVKIEELSTDSVYVYSLCGETVYIDPCDEALLVSGSPWYKVGGYLSSKNLGRGGKNRVLLHRAILGIHGDAYDYSLVTDHINRNTYDNRRGNLRVVTMSENTHNSKMRCNNSTGYKGVRKAKDGSYYASIMVKRKSHSRHGFASVEEAALARVELEREYGYHIQGDRSIYDKEVAGA